MHGLVAVVFDGQRTAGKALETLEDYDPAYPWVEDVAVLSRSKHGVMRVHSTWAQNDSAVGAGMSRGVLTGGLIGLLFGPGGAMAGAAIGASIGGLFGVSSEVLADDPWLDDMVSKLKKDTSALILVGEAPILDEYIATVQALGGAIIRKDLDEADLDALHDALKAPA